MPDNETTLAQINSVSNQITGTFTPGGQNAQLTNKIYCAGNSFIGIQVPTSFVSGNLAFFSSLTGVSGSYYQMTDTTATLISIPTAATGTIISPPANTDLGTPAGIQIPLDPAVFAGIQNLIVYCSNAQTQSQNVQLIMAPVLG